jgi:glycosyltransferase involved in cell wall biosynthesis
MSAVSDPALRVSVIVCTHNPRRGYLNAVVEALRLQSLNVEQWELLIVDNASTEPLAGWPDLAWHPHGRIVREGKLGLTHARLRGIKDSKASLLVFVDDDNVLAPDYLQVALDLAERHPSLGIWSGRIDLEFETPPPEWTRKYWPFLVQRLVERDEMSQALRLEEPLPVGAGMCVRRKVATAYATAAQSSSLRLNLGRCGVGLGSSEDTDMAMLAGALGWQRGVFQALCLRHLIPPERATEDYLVRLTEGILFSSFVVKLLHQIKATPPPINLWWRLKYLCDLATKFGRKRRFYQAAKRAQRRSRKLYEELALGEPRSAPLPSPKATPEEASESTRSS